MNKKREIFSSPTFQQNQNRQNASKHAPQQNWSKQMIKQQIRNLCILHIIQNY